MEIQKLPDDIMFHIMSYLPQSSLFKFRSVCKTWNTLFMHPHLPLLFLHHSLHSGYDLLDVMNKEERKYDDRKRYVARRPQYSNKKKKKEKSKGEDFNLTALSSQALLLEQDSHSLRYRIRCPVLCQRLAIPNPRNPSLCMALEFVSSNQPAVKLVSVYEDDENQYSLGYEILALGVGSDQTTYCWRAVQVPPPNLLNNELHCQKRERIKVFFRMGVVYCIWYVETEDNDLDVQVDVLDMVNETYIGHTTFPRGGGFFSKLSSTQLLDWNGRLSFAQLIKDELHVLVLDDYKKMKWAESKRIVDLPFLKPDHKELIRFSTFADNSILFFVWKDFCFYDTNTGKLRIYNISSDYMNSIGEVSFLSSQIMFGRKLKGVGV